jgi:hypothetical protein
MPRAVVVADTVVKPAGTGPPPGSPRAAAASADRDVDPDADVDGAGPVAEELAADGVAADRPRADRWCSRSPAPEPAAAITASATTRMTRFRRAGAITLISLGETGPVRGPVEGRFPAGRRTPPAAR